MPASDPLALPLKVTVSPSSVPVSGDACDPVVGGLQVTLTNTGAAPLRFRNDAGAGVEPPDLDDTAPCAIDRVYLSFPTGSGPGALAPEALAERIRLAANPSTEGWTSTGARVHEGLSRVSWAIYPTGRVTLDPGASLTLDLTDIVAPGPVGSTVLTAAWAVRDFALGHRKLVVWKEQPLRALVDDEAPPMVFQLTGTVFANTSTNALVPVYNPFQGATLAVTLKNTSPVDPAVFVNDRDDDTLPAITDPPAGDVDVFYVYFDWGTQVGELAPAPDPDDPKAMKISAADPAWIVQEMTDANLQTYWAFAPKPKSKATLAPNTGVGFDVAALVANPWTSSTTLYGTWVLAASGPGTPQTHDFVPQLPPQPQLGYPWNGEVLVTTVSQVQIPNPLNATTLSFSLQNQSTQDFPVSNGLPSTELPPIDDPNPGPVDLFYVYFPWGDPANGALCSPEASTTIIVTPEHPDWQAVQTKVANPPKGTIGTYWTLSIKPQGQGVIPARQSVTFTLSGPPDANGIPGFISSTTQPFRTGNTAMIIAYRLQSYGANSATPTSVRLAVPPAQAVIFSVDQQSALPGDTLTFTMMATPATDHLQLWQIVGSTPSQLQAELPPYNTDPASTGTRTVQAVLPYATTNVQYRLVPIDGSGNEGPAKLLQPPVEPLLSTGTLALHAYPFSAAGKALPWVLPAVAYDFDWTCDHSLSARIDPGAVALDLPNGRRANSGSQVLTTPAPATPTPLTYTLTTDGPLPDGKSGAPNESVQSVSLLVLAPAKTDAVGNAAAPATAFDVATPSSPVVSIQVAFQSGDSGSELMAIKWKDATGAQHGQGTPDDVLQKLGYQWVTFEIGPWTLTSYSVTGSSSPASKQTQGTVTSLSLSFDDGQGGTPSVSTGVAQPGDTTVTKSDPNGLGVLVGFFGAQQAVPAWQPDGSPTDPIVALGLTLDVPSA